jgi:hypothetical protein
LREQYRDVEWIKATWFGTSAKDEDWLVSMRADVLEKIAHEHHCGEFRSETQISACALNGHSSSRAPAIR